MKHDNFSYASGNTDDNLIHSDNMQIGKAFKFSTLQLIFDVANSKMANSFKFLAKRRRKIKPLFIV